MSKFLPILQYALEVCPLTKTHHRSLDFVVMRFLLKVFCTSNSNIVNDCQVYFGLNYQVTLFRRALTNLCALNCLCCRNF